MDNYCNGKKGATERAVAVPVGLKPMIKSPLYRPVPYNLNNYR